MKTSLTSAPFRFLKGKFFLGKPVVYLVAILFFWVILPPAFRTVLRSSFFEFQAPALATASYLKDLGKFWALRGISKNELIESGRDLARLNAAYEVRLQELESLREEVDRLERLLTLPSLPEFRYEVARVVKRDLNNWWQRLVIRKGAFNGVKPGMAVIFSGGVVGRIGEVHTYTATVEMISGPGFRVAAHIEGDLRPVTFHGRTNLPFQDPGGYVDNVPPDIEVDSENPRRVVSSRLGGSFPDGLTLGWVDSLEPGSDGLFLSGTVRLDPRINAIREVAVLVPIEPANPDGHNTADQRER